jgi:hypothetical protein
MRVWISRHLGGFSYVLWFRRLSERPSAVAERAVLIDFWHDPGTRLDRWLQRGTALERPKLLGGAAWRGRSKVARFGLNLGISSNPPFLRSVGFFRLNAYKDSLNLLSLKNMPNLYAFMENFNQLKG